MEWLKVIANQHSEWVSLAHRFGAGSHAEDMVQEMYLHLNQYVKDPNAIITDGKVNKAFIWVSLRNLVRSHQRSKSRGVVEYVDQIHEHLLMTPEEFDWAEAIAFENLIDEIYESTEDLHWYYGAMFKVYFGSDKSMRDISKGSRISLKNIFETIKKTKKHVKEENWENYQDYENQDYHLIKGTGGYGRENN